MKYGTNMGKRNNQNFYNIPFLNIINKMKYKLHQNKIKLILINESYTSKCDALKGEEVCKHKKYKGSRIKRGLFKSAYKSTLINADLNAAINIYRKFTKLKKLKELQFIKKIRKQIGRLQQIKKITIGVKKQRFH